MEPKEVIEKIKEEESKGKRLIKETEGLAKEIVQKAYMETEELIKSRREQANKQAILVKERIMQEVKFTLQDLKKETEAEKDRLKEGALKNFDKAVSFIMEKIKEA